MMKKCTVLFLLLAFSTTTWGLTMGIRGNDVDVTELFNLDSCPTICPDTTCPSPCWPCPNPGICPDPCPCPGPCPDPCPAIPAPGALLLSGIGASVVAALRRRQTL